MKSEAVRQNLRQELASARLQTDQLFHMLAPAALHMRPIPERHRIIFYLGHLETFDWNMVCKWAFEMSPFNAEFDRLFAFGIDPVDGKLPHDKPSDWPAVDEIHSYRDRIRRTIDAVLDAADLEDESRKRIFHVAIEHRFMHAETLAYMLHWLDLDLKTSPQSRREKSEKQTSTQIRSKTIPSGHVTLGQNANGAFGWDNEFKAHSVVVPEFSIDTFNVTNQDYLDFVTTGGYQERSLWTDEAWNWLQQSGIGHPKFWIRRNADWFYRTMFDEIPLPLDWPVYVSHAEASAYCRWNGKTLPTEEQYQRAAFGSREGDSERMPDGNFDCKSWNPMPVGSFAPSAFGVFDLVGNGWEWTRTAFGPFEGFEPFSFYPGYSADFFDGKHFVLKGASPRTAAPLVRSSFRNWFQPHYPNVYATFRCVEQ